MNIRTAELEIPEDDPFRNDVLGRKELEPPLSQFIRSIDGPMVLAIDGGWGTGKTTFLKMLQRKLQQDGHAGLYLNAWQSDFAVDPLVALVGELAEMLVEFSAPSARKKVLNRHIKTIKTVGGKILKRALPVMTRIVTAGAVNTDDFLEEGASDLAEKIVEDQIEAYEQKKSKIDEFRVSLRKIAEEVAKIQGANDAKVVVIVDELDRCRPTYAVDLLERIKHLFDVPKIIFVLGVDRAQLAHSIRASYGAGFDASGYLRRFIDIDYSLPAPEKGKYCRCLFEAFEISKLMSMRRRSSASLNTSGMCDLLGVLFGVTGVSLRTQQQIVARLWVVMQTIPRDEELFARPLLALIFLREWRCDLYNGLVLGVSM